MATQLRLVDTPRTPKPRASRADPARSDPARSTRARRAASWGEWHLDARTRRIGKAGVAAARAALHRAAADEGLPRAS